MPTPFNIYDIGNAVRCSVTFRTISNIIADPNSVFFHLMTPSGTTHLYTYGANSELQKLTTGVYYVDVLAQQQGAYYYRFEGSGTIQSAEESYFVVRPSVFY